MFQSVSQSVQRKYFLHCQQYSWHIAFAGDGVVADIEGLAGHPKDYFLMRQITRQANAVNGNAANLAAAAVWRGGIIAVAAYVFEVCAFGFADHLRRFKSRA